jgi:hypothetical protein
MEINIHNTSKIVSINGLKARLWEGQTKSGIPMHCLVHLVAVNSSENIEEFDRELNEVIEPSDMAKAIPTRMII